MPTASELIERVRAETRPDAQFWAGATDLAQALVGDAVGANVFVVGMAIQTGLLPVSPEALETAIGLNGVAVELNTAAFRWGRWWVADQPMVEEAAVRGAMSAPDDTPTRNQPTGRDNRAVLDQNLSDRISEMANGDTLLAAALEMFTAEMVRFQNRALAARYLDGVAEFAAVERRVNPGTAALTAAVAAGLFKLMAYKDEYEVAPTAARPRRPSPGGCGCRARRPAGLAASSAHPAGYGPKEQDRPVGGTLATADRLAGQGQAPPRHPDRPIRPGQGPPGGALPVRRIPHRPSPSG